MRIALTERRRPSPLPVMPHPVDKDLLTRFGKRIRQLRTARGLSQEKLAELTGFHRTYIGMVERGERNLSLSNIGTFANYFGLTTSELMDFREKAGSEQ